MNKLKCIVVDDEPLAVTMIENYISRTPSLELEASFNDPVLALSEIKARKPHLVFLDIQMPDLSGLDLSRMIPSDTKVIFTTAFKEYALESYEIGAVDYLLKPIRYQKFLEAAERASNWFRIRESAPNTSLPTSIFIKADGNMRRVEFSDILYITGMKDYVSIRLASQRLPLITHITMKAVEDMLPSDSFMRIHRSCIVALGKIESVTPALDLTIAGTVFHVSDQYATLFRAWLETNSLCK